MSGEAKLTQAPSEAISGGGASSPVSAGLLAGLLFSVLWVVGGVSLLKMGQEKLIFTPEAPVVWALPVAQDLAIQIQSVEQQVATIKMDVESSKKLQNTRPFITISISDRRLEYHQGSKIRKMPAAVGMGKTYINGNPVIFDTPIGRFSVTVKEETPLWQPPDWHFQEMSQKTNAKIVHLDGNSRIPLSDGRIIGVQEKQVGTWDDLGTFTPMPPAGDIIIDGRIFVPPPGSPNRYYPEVLGTRRLKLTDAYAIHGTNKPGSVGRASSHGCVRLTNPDIEALYDDVNVGTPVFIY